jgi:hypothetical protein
VSVTVPSIRIQRSAIHWPAKLLETLSPLYTNSSSKTKGRDAKILNGHPTIAPAPKRRVADRVPMSVVFGLLTLVGGTAYENANILQYRAKDDGRKAEEIIR